MNSLDEIQICLPDGSERHFFHRGTRADRGVFAQIFKNKDYDLGRLRRRDDIYAKFKSIIQSGQTPLIIDAGANIGASAVWFALTFPGAKILCFEPDNANFQILKSNSIGLDVELYEAAIGAVDGTVDLLDPGEGEWGYQTQPNPYGLVKMMSISHVVNHALIKGYVPFIIKIDIEGGEGELFSSETNWIDEFPLLIIELHDWLLPMKKTSASFLRAISPLDRDFVYIGENIFSIKN